MAGWGRRFRIAIQGRDPRRRDGEPVHLAFLPGAARRRRVAGRRRLARRRRVAGGRRHQVRQPRSHRGALSAVLQDARVPPGFRRRRAVSRRPRRGASRWWSRPTSRRSATPPATACKYGACGILGGEDGAAAPLHAAFRNGGSRARSRPRKPASRSAPATVSCSNPAAAAAGAIRQKRDPAATDEDVENGFVTDDTQFDPLPACGGGSGWGHRAAITCAVDQRCGGAPEASAGI